VIMNKSSPKVKNILFGGLIDYDTKSTEEENRVLVITTPNGGNLKGSRFCRFPNEVSAEGFLRNGRLRVHVWLSALWLQLKAFSERCR
jgi:hypothetical protein